MKRKTKYLVVGGGLAGSACAYLLKAAGEEVLLVERLDAKAKSKLCAGLCTPRAIDMLHKLYGFEIEPLFKQNLTTLRCIADDMTIDLANITTKSVMRNELDAFSLQKYLEVGGELVDRLSIRNFDLKNKRVSGFVDHDEMFECSYEVLIGADGALSDVRKALTGSGPDAILSLEAQVESNGQPYIMAYAHDFFGYSWYAPAGEFAKIGCCAYRGEPDLRSQLNRFADEVGVQLGKVRGAYIPTGKDVLLRKGDTYLLGDAAGLICPPSGEGIYFALYSAWQLLRALLTGSSYQALMNKKCAEIARQYKTRDLFFNQKFMSVGLKVAESTPYGKERAVKYALKHFAAFE